MRDLEVLVRRLALALPLIATVACTAQQLAGRELSVQPGLPLGLIAESAHSETAFRLSAGEQLTLLNDGVVEATDPTSKELFGFDRTAAISNRSADEIAAVAKDFGQEDDITVLTLQSRLPA